MREFIIPSSYPLLQQMHILSDHCGYFYLHEPGFIAASHHFFVWRTASNCFVKQSEETGLLQCFRSKFSSPSARLGYSCC